MKQEPVRLCPRQWNEVLETQILDYDGFDRHIVVHETPLRKEEFLLGLGACTIEFPLSAIGAEVLKESIRRMLGGT